MGQCGGHQAGGRVRVQDRSEPVSHLQLLHDNRPVPVRVHQVLVQPRVHPADQAHLGACHIQGRGIMCGWGRAVLVVCWSDVVVLQRVWLNKVNEILQSNDVKFLKFHIWNSSYSFHYKEMNTKCKKN